MIDTASQQKKSSSQLDMHTYMHINSKTGYIHRPKCIVAYTHADIHCRGIHTVEAYRQTYEDRT